MKPGALRPTKTARRGRVIRTDEGRVLSHEEVLVAVTERAAVELATTGRPKRVLCTGCKAVLRVARKGAVPSRCRTCQQRERRQRRKGPRPKRVLCTVCNVAVKVSQVGSIPSRCRRCQPLKYNCLDCGAASRGRRCRSCAPRARAATMTPEQRLEAEAKMAKVNARWATMTPEQRLEAMREAHAARRASWASMTPEERSALVRKGAAKRRPRRPP